MGSIEEASGFGSQFMEDRQTGRALRGRGSRWSHVMQDLQNGGNGPSLSLTAEGAVLAVLIGQLWQALP